MITDKQIERYLNDLAQRFPQNKSDYYLSYSGGKDSHFLYWFIKEYLHDNEIVIVGVNTYMEHPQILKRIKENSDVVLLPEIKPFEIKDKYGIPCFSKVQDEIIRRFQNGSRAPSTMNFIYGLEKDGTKNNGRFKLNKIAKTKLLDETLHKVSSECCKYLKKKPVHEYEKMTNKKPILGVRGAEGGGLEPPNIPHVLQKMVNLHHCGI